MIYLHCPSLVLLARLVGLVLAALLVGVGLMMVAGSFGGGPLRSRKDRT